MVSLIRIISKLLIRTMSGLANIARMEMRTVERGFQMHISLVDQRTETLHLQGLKTM